MMSGGSLDLKKYLQSPSTEMAERWYRWILSLDNKHGNPLRPQGGGAYSLREQPNDIIFLGGLTATTEPANKPSEISSNTALVSSAIGTAVYNNGFGKGVPKANIIRKTDWRKITLTDKDERPFYFPFSTEFTGSWKYHKYTGNLQHKAKEIIFEENIPPGMNKDGTAKGIPQIFIQVSRDSDGKDVVGRLEKDQLMGYNVEGLIKEIGAKDDDIFLLPEGNGQAGYYDYAAVLNRTALQQDLKQDEYFISFGILERTGKIFDYQANYQIIVDRFPSDSTST